VSPIPRLTHAANIDVAELRMLVREHERDPRRMRLAWLDED